MESLNYLGDLTKKDYDDLMFCGKVYYENDTKAASFVEWTGKKKKLKKKN